MPRIFGLHLWAVSYSETPTSLWITTARRDAEEAARKARVFCRRRRAWRDRLITAVKYHGTLDG